MARSCVGPLSSICAGLQSPHRDPRPVHARWRDERPNRRCERTEWRKRECRQQGKGTTTRATGSEQRKRRWIWPSVSARNTRRSNKSRTRRSHSQGGLAGWCGACRFALVIPDDNCCSKPMKKKWWIRPEAASEGRVSSVSCMRDPIISASGPTSQITSRGAEIGTRKWGRRGYRGGNGDAEMGTDAERGRTRMPRT